MPTIADKPNVAAAQILGKQLVQDSGNLTISQLKDAYAGFRGALATPELKAEMDKFIAGADPHLAGLVGADKAVAQFDLKAQTDAVWGKFFAREPAKLELFTAVFGAAKVAEVPDGWKHLIEGRFDKEEGGKLIYGLTMSKPGPPDPRGFDVLITHGVASGKIAIDPKDMSWTVVGAPPPSPAAPAAPFDAAKASESIWGKFFARDDDRKAMFTAVFGAAVANTPGARMEASQSGPPVDGKLAYDMSMWVKAPNSGRGGFDVLMVNEIARTKVLIDPKDMSWTDTTAY
jgi:hypothetical protein